MCIFRTLIFILICSSATLLDAQVPPLSLSQNKRFLSTEDGKVVYLNGDTGWNLARLLSREDAEHYVKVRKEQDFNLLGVSAIHTNNPTNIYGDAPFHRIKGTWDLTKPDTTAGIEPGNRVQYDYWDHLDYVLGLIEAHEMYVALVVCFNSWVVGSGNGQDTSQIIFSEVNAYAYGYFLGDRYKDKQHILWMMGGDRSAVYGELDYTAVYRAMAEGVADGIKGRHGFDGIYDMEGILMSFHPQKRHPNSSRWFHEDEWLSFNSVQACPWEQEELLRADYQLNPVKPTWLFEGRYEHYSYAYKAWHVRFQAYLSVFAGGFGHVYGNEAIWDFDPSWKTDIYWDGGLHMKYLNYILTEGLEHAGFGDLHPDTLILADTPKGTTSTHCWNYKSLEAPYSSRIAALATEDYSTVLVYAADGSTVKLNSALLPAPYKAYWYDPRTGRFSATKEILHKAALEADQFSANDSTLLFDFPGEAGMDNDWVLLLEHQVKSP